MSELRDTLVRALEQAKDDDLPRMTTRLEDAIALLDAEGERIEGWVERRCNYCDGLWSMRSPKCHSSPYVDDSHNFQTRHEQNTPMAANKAPTLFGAGVRGRQTPPTDAILGPKEGG